MSAIPVTHHKDPCKVQNKSTNIHIFIFRYEMNELAAVVFKKTVSCFFSKSQQLLFRFYYQSLPVFCSEKYVEENAHFSCSDSFLFLSFPNAGKTSCGRLVSILCNKCSVSPPSDSLEMGVRIFIQAFLCMFPETLIASRTLLFPYYKCFSHSY